MANTLADYDTAIITAVKSFIVQAPAYYDTAIITVVKSFIVQAPSLSPIRN